MKYDTGEEIHAGDVVVHSGKPARIVAVFDAGEYAPGFLREHWQRYSHGFLVRDDSGEVFMYEDVDEDLEFVSRS